MHLDSTSSSTIDTQTTIKRSTPERVLDTAAALFWEKGFAATTTREIAAAVGIQQASLYHHIASKEELLYQLCISSMEQLLTGVRSAVDRQSDALDRLRSLIRAHLSTLLKHQVRHITMLAELHALSNRHHAEVVALRKKYASLVRVVLQEAQLAGRIRDDIPSKYLYLGLLNVLNWEVVWYWRDPALGPDQLADLFTPIYLHGAMAPPAHLSLELPSLNSRRRTSRFETKMQKPGRVSISPRLLDAAAVLFANKGYGATSTREIAMALGIRKASLYYHIGSKEDLLYRICKSSLETIHRDVKTALKDVHTPMERISALMSAHVESMLRHQKQHSVTVAEMHLLSPGRLAEVRALRDDYERLVHSVLQQAQKVGLLRRDIPLKYVCPCLLGLMNRLEIWYRGRKPLSPREFARLLEVIFLTGAAARPTVAR